jgi:hypothetical protein
MLPNPLRPRTNRKRSTCRRWSRTDCRLRFGLHCCMSRAAEASTTDPNLGHLSRSSPIPDRVILHGVELAALQRMILNVMHWLEMADLSNQFAPPTTVTRVARGVDMTLSKRHGGCSHTEILVETLRDPLGVANEEGCDSMSGHMRCRLMCLPCQR